MIANNFWETVLNPYSPSDGMASPLSQTRYRSFRTYVDAAAIAFFQAFIAPLYFCYVTGLLFSAYFSAVGYGYIRGSVLVGAVRIYTIIVVPALITGISAMLHIVCRPRKIDKLLLERV